MKFFFMFFRDKALPVFYREHELQVNLGIGVGHCFCFRRYKRDAPPERFKLVIAYGL
jgi:hypothetical protein